MAKTVYFLNQNFTTIVRFTCYCMLCGQKEYFETLVHFIAVKKKKINKYFLTPNKRNHFFAKAELPFFKKIK